MGGLADAASAVRAGDPDRLDLRPGAKQVVRVGIDRRERLQVGVVDVRGRSALT